MMKFFTLPLLALALAACDTTVSKEELASVNYGPPPQDWQKMVNDYLEPRVPDLKVASVSFRTQPQQFLQKETVLRKRQWGWAACVWVLENHPRGYPETYPLVFFFRDGRITEVNGGPDDSNIVGRQYAREQCERLGAPFNPG